MKTNYLYCWTDPRTNVPFYLGKGTENQAYSRLENHSSNNIQLNERVKELKALNLKPIITIFPLRFTPKIAIAMEKRWIKHLGRMDLGTGPLLNRTVGGGGFTRRKRKSPSPETREKLRQAMIKRMEDPETRAKVSMFHRGRKRTMETKSKMSKARLGIKLSESHCNKLSVARLGKKLGPFSEEHKAKISASNRKTYFQNNRHLENRARNDKGQFIKSTITEVQD